MPLKRIELCDFKSYRGHQIIGPFTHFNAIIGPNGAGKSNLMDAISFVLGVKSAQLRSSQLKDLVYRGRKLAADNLDGVGPSDASLEADEDDERGGEGTASRAWVLAVYEDENEKEWKFKRTISLAGSSDYQLNGKSVTYQTYNAALEKQNILVKAKNFLVFQGDVEAVASQSPLALTKLIEQISGSLELASEYDVALKAQERATENATFNYTKRRGINGEIKQFKEQKTEAQRFESLVDERDDEILHKHLWKLYHIEEELEEHARQIKSQAKSVSGLKKEKKTHDTALNRARETQAAARSEVLSKEKKIKKADKAVDKKRPDLTAIEAQIAHAIRKRNNAEKIKETVKKDLKNKEDSIARMTKDFEDVQKASDAAQEASRKNASKKDVSLSASNLDEYRKLKAEANILHVTERQEFETLSREDKTSARNLSGIEDKLREFEEKKSNLEGEKVTVGERNEELQTKVATLQSDLATAKQELENAQSERERISRTETEINEKLHDVHTKLLQAGVDRRESEKEINMKETFATLQRIFPGVRGRVIDLCKPTQRKYETAVSVILGRNIDAVVVDLEKTAIECIQYMRDQRAGQATFLPMDTIQVKPINDKYRSFAKGSRLALDVLEFDGSVERAMHYACGNALVCDTMEVARHVVYDKGQEIKAVTLDGTIIHKSGLITGGHSTHGSGKKWEDKDIQGLHRQKDHLLEQLRGLNQSKPRNHDDNLVAEITRLESSLSLARDDLNAAKSRLSGIRDELKYISQSIKKLKPDLDKARQSRGQTKSQMDQLREIIDKAEDRVFDAFCRKIKVDNIRDYEGRQLKVAQEESDARLRFSTQIARLKTQLEFDESQAKDTRDRLATLENTTSTEGKNLADLEKKKAVTEEEIQEMENSVAELKEELKDVNTVLDDRTRELQDVKREHEKAAKALDKLLKEISTRNDDIEKLGSSRSGIYRKCRLENIKLPLLSGSLSHVPMEESLREDMAMDVDEEDGDVQPKEVDDYGIEIDFDSLDDDDREDGSLEAGAKFEDSIAKLNAEIEKMTPNMKANDKLEDVEAKLAEMERETDKARKDSKTAREHFQAVKKQRSDLFMKAFDHISKRIDAVYKELTKGRASPMGGVAYLSLEESEEPYLGGIKYHAMPPMKRFRDMEQLSGGEKTIAAMALLFAVHSYQPSPFFVLDEVDAALDNTNVARIANYIREQASEKFQFVVISLKGSLYERSNSLVGIYRDQDVNSSKTLTLDLSQYDE